MRKIIINSNRKSNLWITEQYQLGGERKMIKVFLVEDEAKERGSSLSGRPRTGNWPIL